VTAPLLVVYRALGLGDLLTAVPALRALARAYPEHRRALAAPGALARLTALIGAIDEVVDAPALRRLPAALHEADLAVNLHGRGPQSHAVLLAGNPRRMVAFAHEGVWPGAVQWRAGEHECARWCRLLSGSGISADPADLRIAVPTVPPPDATRGATLLHPGAADPARRWPAVRWAAVAQAELAAGRRVAITGSASERGLACAIAAAGGLPAGAVFAGRTTLVELAAAVAGAARVVCGDTGVAHLATALGTPSVVLFGPTAPTEWGPPADRRHVALWAGRRGDPHAREADLGLLQIPVVAVLAALGGLTRG
jgi:ADP-heptose:LPS heptosyltransferase